MRLVVQRVSKAHVSVQGQICGAIQSGLLVLLGIHKEDQLHEISWYVNKLVHLRIFNDQEGKMNLSLKQVKGEVLVISQFTLYADCSSGRRPGFSEAAPPHIALPIYQKFIEELRREVDKVETGEFGAEMQVCLINEGPITLIIDSEKKSGIG